METYGLTARQQSLLMDFFQQVAGVDRVFIYGSRAKGTQKPTSDIDLAVRFALDAEVSLARLKSDLDDLPILLAVDVIDAATLPEGHFRADFEATKKLFYRRNVSSSST
jgi:predicted nucleotidyltransferase